MDGYETLERLKNDETLRSTPVIMISALEQIRSVIRCIEMGAEDYLPKPFDPVLLYARVNAALEKKFLRDQEIQYLQQVKRLTEAAAAVEAATFAPESLADVAQRGDDLGQLARVFQRMAKEVAAREQRLKQQLRELRIEIDEARKNQQVAEVTGTDYFQQLQLKADSLRQRVGEAFEHPPEKPENQPPGGGFSPLDLLQLSPKMNKVFRIVLNKVEITYNELCEVVDALPTTEHLSRSELNEALTILSERGLLVQRDDNPVTYKAQLRRTARPTKMKNIWDALERDEEDKSGGKLGDANKPQRSK